jgi:hypothetical protein
MGELQIVAGSVYAGHVWGVLTTMPTVYMKKKLNYRG